MAQTFNNGESNASVRTKLNGNADEINEIVEDVIPTLVPSSRTVAGKPLTSDVSLAKADVGLNNVDNTADLNKPISNATQVALDAKAPTNNPTFTGTVSGITKTTVGLSNVDNTSDAGKPVSTAQAAAIGARVPNTRTVNGKALSVDINITKGDVGLGNADNTSDAAKPISTATAEALTHKADLDDEGFVETDQLPDVGLSNVQFEQLTIDDELQPITIKDTWLVNKIIEVGIAQGWGTLTPLDPPVISFGTSTETQNIINWTRPLNGVTSELQLLVGGVWNPLYSGTSLSFTHNGLVASTEYSYRVRALADGYTPSSYDTGNKTTASGGGVTLVQTVKLRLGVNAHEALPTGWALWLANGPGNTSPIDNTEGDDAGFLLVDTLSTTWSEEESGVPLVTDPDFPDAVVKYLSYNTDPGTTKTVVFEGCNPAHSFQLRFGIMQGYDDATGGTKIIINGVDKGNIMCPIGFTVYKNSPFVVTPTIDGDIVIDLVPVQEDGYAPMCAVILQEYS